MAALLPCLQEVSHDGCHVTPLRVLFIGFVLLRRAALGSGLWYHSRQTPSLVSRVPTCIVYCSIVYCSIVLQFFLYAAAVAVLILDDCTILLLCTLPNLSQYPLFINVFKHGTVRGHVKWYKKTQAISKVPFQFGTAYMLPANVVSIIFC